MPNKSKFCVGVISILCLILVIITGVLFLRNIEEDKELEEEIKVVEKIRDEAVITTQTSATTESVVGTEPSVEVIDDENLLREIDFTYLQDINPDCTRWVYIPDTNIDYPVMQEPEYRQAGDYHYLHRNFYDKWSSSGSIFTLPQVFNGNEDAHLILFGHHMVDKTVAFSNLRGYYLSEENGSKHKYIYLYYPDHSERWLVWTTATGVNTDKVYTIPYTLGTQDYQDMIDDIANKGEYQLCEKPTCETKLLVLSTCNGRYAGQTYRLYVVAVPEARYYYSTKTLEKEIYYEQ